MGFKELSKFNDSLLAKQICCLDKNEDSLFHKVFKAKFFPNCSIMESEFEQRVLCLEKYHSSKTCY